MVSKTSIQALTENDIIRFYKISGIPGPNIPSVRSGLSDAAHLIDAIAKDIVSECCPGRKKPRKDIQQVVRCLTRAADAVWLMREKLQHEYSEDKK